MRNPLYIANMKVFLGTKKMSLVTLMIPLPTPNPNPKHLNTLCWVLVV